MACVQQQIEKVKKELSMLEKDEKIYTHYSTTHAKNLYYFTNLSEVGFTHATSIRVLFLFCFCFFTGGI